MATRPSLKLVEPTPSVPPAFSLSDRTRAALVARDEAVKAKTRADAQLAALGREAADALRMPMRLTPDQLRRSLDRGEL